ncbi:MAG TPA: acetylxylan esterase [Candidatus Hydrogenedentes bacterium]|nr:acetylxylan esterase [Candidatus Hydrogenedentota bacterium]HPG69278.1 acetylxylan esterase [Candidatus Hydrogenedentota bacterium]
MRILLVIVLALAAARVAQAEDLAVLGAAEGDASPKAMMKTYLNAQCAEALARRMQAYEEVKTVEAGKEYQAQRKAFFVEQLGGWPERTPLNAQIVAEVPRDGYRIQKVIFESRPKFFVTALMYLPLADPPYPAVLVPCGHSDNGKAYESYQRASIILALNGMAALCYDPIGQGERHQHLLESGQPAVASSTIEHTLVGVGAILVGMNTASFRIWDGIRGIDYLTERDDIDAERIGCAGNSGGGTLTSYLMALDERIKAAAPNCYLTSFEKLIPEAGPQDAEQNIYGQVAFGMNHADYAIMRAPNPTLFCTATRDFFDIAGAWDSFRQAKRFYTRLGFAERVDIIEADEEHGFTEPLRVATTRWMRRWLLDTDDAITESDFPVLSDDEARCTPQGQVMTLEGARSAWDILTDRETELAAPRKAFLEGASPADLVAKVRELAGIRPLAKLPEPEIERVDSVGRIGYAVERLVIKPEAGIHLPALAFLPETPNADAYLYLHGQGKAEDAAEGGPIDALVKAGHIVLAVDLRGMGETECEAKHEGWTPYFGPDWQDYFRAYLLGRSYLGMRAEDALACGRFLAGYLCGETPRAVHVVAIGEAAPPVLHAAVAEPEVFASVHLEGMVTSWADTVRTPVTSNQLVNTLHGVLAWYDLPDLVAALPEGKVTVASSVTPAGGRLD